MKFVTDSTDAYAAEVMEAEYVPMPCDAEDGKKQYFANAEGYSTVKPWCVGKVTGRLYIANIE